jgi:hypothetical protein
VVFDLCLCGWVHARVCTSLDLCLFVWVWFFAVFVSRENPLCVHALAHHVRLYLCTHGLPFVCVCVSLGAIVFVGGDSSMFGGTRGEMYWMV